MSFTKAVLDEDSLHRVMQGDTLVAVKGSVILYDDELGEQRVRFQMTGDDLVAWVAAANKSARKGLLRAFVQTECARRHKQWKAEPPVKRGVPLDADEFGGDL